MDQTNIGEMIADTARRIIGGQANKKGGGAAARDASLWRDLEESGLTSAWEPDGNSPLGIPVEAAFEVMRISARHGLNAPLVETMFANWLLRKAGLEVPPGPLSVAPVRAIDTLEAERTGDGLRVRGAAGRVPWGAYAEHILVHVTMADGAFVGLVPSASVTSVPAENVAGEPRDRLEFDVVLPSSNFARINDGSNIRQLGALIRAAQMTGAMDEALSLSIQYASDRVQFGRPLRKFQVIQHYLATMASQSAAARASVDVAVRALTQPHAGHAIAAAKIRAGEAAGQVARLAHQIHGAIGFTQEYRLQTLSRRLWSWRDEFGTEAEWSRELGRIVCDLGPDQTWQFITARMA